MHSPMVTQDTSAGLCRSDPDVDSPMQANSLIFQQLAIAHQRYFFAHCLADRTEGFVPV